MWNTSNCTFRQTLMPSTNDPSAKKGLFALFKGAPNTGKSVAAYSFPNVFVFDFDRKMPTVAQKHFPEKVFNWKAFEDVYSLSDFLKPWLLPKDLGGTVCPYETLVVDTVTSLSTICLRSVDITKGTNVVEMMKTLSKTKSGEKSVEVMGYDYYNAEANFFERYFMDNLKILWAREGNPRHIIVIAHEVTVESAPHISTGVIKTTKSIVTAGRKCAAFIPKCFDEELVFKLERPIMGDTLTKTKRNCITNTDMDEDARTCYPFPDIVEFSNKSLYEELNKYAHWD